MFDYFLLASWLAMITVGNLIPGPDFIYVTFTSLRAPRLGWLAALGLQTGVLCHSLGSSLVILLGTHGLAWGAAATGTGLNGGKLFFAIMGIIGAVYLSRLGYTISTSAYRQLRFVSHNQSPRQGEVAELDNVTSANEATELSAASPSEFAQRLEQHQHAGELTARQAYVGGFLCNILNPKCFLFMFTMLPLFVNPEVEASVEQQLLLLCGVNLLDGLVIWLLLSLLVSRVVAIFQSQKFNLYLELVSGTILLLLGIGLFCTAVGSWWN